MSIKAETAYVRIGCLTLQGLMSENGDFGVAVPQAVELDLVPRDRSIKQLESFTGQSIEVIKWKTPLNPKAVNVIPLENLERTIFAFAQKGIPGAVKAWNQIHPETPLVAPKSAPVVQRKEVKMENFVMDLYREFHPRRQVITDFGIADVVHDYGVVEIKEFQSIRSAHTAMGQAMSYGSILGKQPEVLLFNVPDSEIWRITAMFTAVGMLVLVYNKEDTRLAVKRRKWHPTCSNATEIQFQIAKY